MNHEKYSLNPRQQKAFNKTENYLNGQKESVIYKLKKIVETFGFKNKHKLPDDGKLVIRLEFYYSMDNMAFRLNAIKNDFSDYDTEVYEIFENHTDELDLQGGYVNAIDGNQYPLDEPFLDFYENNRCEMLGKMLHHLVTSWFANLWQEAGGLECGTFAVTIQNNSIDIFNLMNLRWDDESPFPEDPDEEIHPYFSRHLSKFEIEQRVNIRMAMISTNYFRYFENENEYLEFGLYKNILGIRSGQKGKEKKFDLSTFATRIEAESKLIEYCDNAILSNFHELPPTSENRLFEDAIDMGNLEITRNLPSIEKSEFVKFESLINASLPSDYKSFLILNNGGYVTSNDQNFPISKKVWRRIKTFFGIDSGNKELSLIKYFDLLKNKLKGDFLAIANDRNDDFICLGIVEFNLGKIFLYEKDNGSFSEISPTFQDFLNGFFDDQFVDDEITKKAKQNDLNYFGELIKKGWAVNTPIKDETTVLFHALSNRHIKLIDLLLKNGATLNFMKDWNYSYVNDENLLEVFQRNGFKIENSEDGKDLFKVS
jgi:hypothetical protein